MHPPVPENELERLRTLHAIEILDTAPELVFDRLTRLVAKILDVPVALISLVDADRQWFKSRVGTEVIQTPRDIAFCAHAVAHNSALVVEDATQDERFMHNPLVTDNPNIRFYAGIPVHSQQGLPLGTLCAIDSKPRHLTADQLSILNELAETVSRELQLREATMLARAQLTRAHIDAKAAETLFYNVFESSGVGIAVISPKQEWLTINAEFCKITGYSVEELREKTLEEITYKDDITSDQVLRDNIKSGKIDRYNKEKRYIRKDGSTIWVSLAVTSKKNSAGVPEYFIAVVKDIQARKVAESALSNLRQSLEKQVETRTAELSKTNEVLQSALAQQIQAEKLIRRREAELDLIIQNANDAYVCIDCAGLVTAWNLQAEATFGWSASEVLGQPLEAVIVPPNMRDAHQAGLARYLATGETRVIDKRIEIPALKKDGTLVPVEIRIRALNIDGNTIFSAFLHDISDRKRIEAEREREARTDTLTGLPNRRALFEVLNQAIARSSRTFTSLAVLFIDLDGFKAINDSQGHKAGDTLLKEIANRLRHSVRKTDSVFRLGGDEFTVILENLNAGMQYTVMLAHKLLACIQEPVSIGEITAHVGASIGVTFSSPNSTLTSDQLLNQADAAMYEAKNAGKARVCVFTTPSTSKDPSPEHMPSEPA